MRRRGRTAAARAARRAGIARRYDIGYDSLRNANPGVDQWLPGVDTPIYLPTMSILPDSPRDGVVVNLPAMRIFYFTPDDAEGAVDAANSGAAAVSCATELNSVTAM